MVLDYNHTPTTSDILAALIDRAMEASAAQQERRTYIGGSRLGEECARALQYEYTGTSKDPGKEFSGQTLRRFARGHVGETLMAGWIKDAGFDLWTEKADGRQFGFSDADGEIKGHLDGVITGAPEGFPIRPTMDDPMLWENKVLASKSWNDLEKKKLAVSKKVYYVQVNLYMAYKGITKHPALFTALNADDMRIYAELVPFDAAVAQAAIDKGVNIIKATRAHELLPRVAASSDSYLCRFCSWAGRCWA